MMNNDEVDIPVKAIAAINQGRKIEAIKIVREENSVGLKEAKELVEKYIETHPEVQDKFKASITPDRLGLIIAVICVVVLLFYFMR